MMYTFATIPRNYFTYNKLLIPNKPTGYSQQFPSVRYCKSVAKRGILHPLDTPQVSTNAGLGKNAQVSPKKRKNEFKDRKEIGRGGKARGVERGSKRCNCCTSICRIFVYIC